MKRLVLLSSAATLAAIAAPNSAGADPGILYIPTEAIDLVPTAECPIAQGGQPHSGLGCGGVAEAGTVEPYAGDMDGLMTGVSDAVVDYDVLVTNTRPPPYVPYYMLMPSDVVAREGTSFTCTSAGISCGGRNRNDIAFINGGTENCTEPDPVHAALYAFGRMSGLEGTDDATSPMGYVPDYTAPATAYSATCANLVQQIGFNDQDEQINLPLECTSLDHEPCDADDQQNDQADLLAFYDARVEDVDAPVLSDVSPEDGATIEGSLDLTVTVADADVLVGVSWTIQSEALDGLEGTLPGGIISRCTNNACQTDWGHEANTPDEDYSLSIPGLPDGDYVITLEAADHHGNVAETITINVAIAGGGGDEGVDETGDGADDDPSDDGPDDGPDDDGPGDDSSVFTTGADETGDGNGDGGADGGDEDPDGCACAASPESGGLMVLLLGLFGLGLRRRD